MSRNTGISWTEHTWNCLRGCTKVSEGCKYCYAMSIAARFSGPGEAFAGFAEKNPNRWTGRVELLPHKLTEPLTWTNSSLVFVNSMSDLFHDGLTDDEIVLVFEVMRLADWHVFQLLTKRHERMASMLSGPLKRYADLDHIWWGVSVENRKDGLPRVDALRETTARVKWLSVEPLLGDLGQFDLTGINWVVVGGESGKHLLDPSVATQRALVREINGLWLPRSHRKDWFRTIRDQCASASIPFYVKQWGGPEPKSAGRLLDGCLHDEYPELVREAVPDAKGRKALKDEFRKIALGLGVDVDATGTGSGNARSAATLPEEALDV